MKSMKIVKKPDGYWIKDIPEGTEPCGPYATKEAAEETMRGLDRFFKYWDEPGFMTVDDKRLKRG